MPEISRFLGIIIKMYFDDHLPPHFHAIYGDDEAMFVIDPIDIIKGKDKFPPRVAWLVIEWATIYKEELIANWNLMKEKKFIQPLWTEVHRLLAD